MRDPGRNMSDPRSATRRRAQQLDQRLRREQRELAREMQERTGRQAIPRRDDGPPPRID